MAYIVFFAISIFLSLSLAFVLGTFGAFGVAFIPLGIAIVSLCGMVAAFFDFQ